MVLPINSISFRLVKLKSFLQTQRRKEMQDNLFAKLPIALIKCGLYAELQPTSIVVYNVLLSYANFKTGVCFPSVTTISALSGLDRKTVIQAIKELEDWGLIQVNRRKGSHNVYQLQYWWDSEETSTKFSTSGVENFHQSSGIFGTRTTTNNKNQINRTNVVQWTESSKDSATSQAKKLVYQLRIADIQQQQAWTNAIQELFRRLFHKELPAEIIDEKVAQGIKAQFLLQILKNIERPETIRNPIGWFRSISEDWSL
jgi:DNA-binding transcriptional regulator YhcF (GntR family)